MPSGRHKKLNKEQPEVLNDISDEEVGEDANEEVEEENLDDELDFDHQGNMDDWLIIDKIEDVVVGTSIPYNYEKSRFKK